MYLTQKGFREHGAEFLNLNVESRHTNMLRSEAGLSLTTSFCACDGCFAPSVWLSAVNETYLGTKHYEAAFINQPGEFAVRTWNKAITLWSPGAEISFMGDEGLDIALRYSAELNGQTTTQKGAVRFEWRF